MHLLSPPQWSYAWLVIASFIAGVMNAMAGGGSFLSFPAMLGVGVPPVQANATNTVALWPGQLTSLATLRGDVRADLLPTLAITSVLGGVSGAETLLHTGQGTFVRLIPWLILTGTLLFALSGPLSNFMRTRRAGKHGHRESDAKISALPLAAMLFPVCFYIGYFGAGGGILVMAVLALFGVADIHTLNAMKVVAATLANLCALLTFILRGAVVWHDCLVAMIFAGAGGYMGARLAKRTNPAALRATIVGTGLVIAAYFFYRQAHA